LEITHPKVIKVPEEIEEEKEKIVPKRFSSIINNKTNKWRSKKK